jgi:hypothetical protein
VLERCQPWALTLEYNKEEGFLLEQFGRLKEMAGNTSQE